MAWPRSTQRPLNRCEDCAYTWHPRGKNVSLKCPSCGSDAVIVPHLNLKGCLIAFVVLMAIPVVVAILSAIVSFLVEYGILLLACIAFSGAMGAGFLLIRSVVNDFAKNGSDFDTTKTIVLLVKLVLFIILAIALMIILANTIRDMKRQRKLALNQASLHMAASNLPAELGVFTGSRLWASR